MQRASTLATNQHSTPKQHLLSTVQIGRSYPDSHKGESRPYRQCKNNKQECAAGQVTNWENTWKEIYETLAHAEIHTNCSGCMHTYTFQGWRPADFGCLSDRCRVECAKSCGPQLSMLRQNQCGTHEDIVLEGFHHSCRVAFATACGPQLFTLHQTSAGPTKT